jgi:hypothetical protein
MAESQTGSVSHLRMAVGPQNRFDQVTAIGSGLTPVRHPRRFGLQGRIHDSGDLVHLIHGLSSPAGSDVPQTVYSPSPKRFRHRITVFRFAESRSPIAISGSPAAAARTIRQRKALAVEYRALRSITLARGATGVDPVALHSGETITEIARAEDDPS